MGDDAGRLEPLAEAAAGLKGVLDLAPPFSRWVQLATVDERSGARVRTVLLHAVSDELVLTFATDAASEKVKHVRARPLGEVCVLSRERWEQWRLRASFALGDDAARGRVWRELPPRERGYYISPPPGLDRGRFTPTAFHAEANDEVPAGRFAVLIATVVAIDRLDASITPHRRWAYERGEGGGWSKRELTP